MERRVTAMGSLSSYPFDLHPPKLSYAEGDERARQTRNSFKLHISIGHSS
jgi:hypothetical protein